MGVTSEEDIEVRLRRRLEHCIKTNPWNKKYMVYLTAQLQNFEKEKNGEPLHGEIKNQ